MRIRGDEDMRVWGYENKGILSMRIRGGSGVGGGMVASVGIVGCGFGVSGLALVAVG